MPELEAPPARTPLERLRAAGGAAAPEDRDLRGLRLIDEDLSGIDLSGCDLSGSDLSRCRLTGARLVGAKLCGTVLYRADLTDCEALSADLSEANLTECRADRAGLGSANLEGACMFQATLDGATLTAASLGNADLRRAQLEGARLIEADLTGCTLDGADLRNVDLQRAKVGGASFRDADLRASRMRRLEGYAECDWIGADIADVDFCGAYLIRRTIADQNYLHEFRTESRSNAALYWVWKVTSDCGRSFLRWGLWTCFLAVVFAMLFELVAVDYGDHETFLSSLYYSVVTLTTLGYGDVLPASPWAQIVAMVEVVIGYVMLGGLLSIFSNKMARRAD